MTRISFVVALALIVIHPLFGKGYDPFTDNSGSLIKTGDNSITSNDSLEDGPEIPEIQFTNNEISMAFQIISDATGWSIFPSNEVSKAKISLWAKKISAKELLKKTVLVSGFVYQHENGVIKVMTYSEYMEYCGVGKSIIKLKYATADPILNVLKLFLTKHGKIIVHKATNTIILYEIEKNINFLEKIIDELDTPSEDHTVEVIEIKYANPESVHKILSEVFVKNGQDEVNRPKSEKKNESSSETSTNLPANLISIHLAESTNRLVISGTKEDVEQVKQLLKKIDLPSDVMQIEVVALEYADSEVLSKTLNDIFSKNNPANESVSKKTILNGAASSNSSGTLMNSESPVTFFAVGRTNRLIIKGFRQDVLTILKLVKQLDTYTESTTQNYHLVYIEASDIFAGLEKVLGGRKNRSGSRNQTDESTTVNLSLLENSNSIVLTGPPSTHCMLKNIIKNIDKPMPYDSGIIRVYELENADAQEVATTIQDLISSEGENNLSNNQATFDAPNEKIANNNIGTSSGFVQKTEAKVSTNKSINAVIIQASAQKQQEFERLIERLDERRKQVLIEAMIVEVITQEGSEFGVELSHAKGNNLAFSSFGLSTLDTATGKLDILASPGGTAAVLTADTIQGLVKALRTSDNVRIESTPKVLVNDNAIGFIENLSEEPIKTVSQGQNSDQVSFGGYEKAGTVFQVTPHISEHDYLKIQYSISLSSFSEQTDPELPPSKTSDNIQSEATIPNGSTIVVGGLQTTVENKSVDKIPFLGDIPIIGMAFRNTVTRKRHVTTYLFITPTIMKDEGFTDLKEISNQSISEIEKNEE